MSMDTGVKPLDINKLQYHAFQEQRARFKEILPPISEPSEFTTAFVDEHFGPTSFLMEQEDVGTDTRQRKEDKNDPTAQRLAKLEEQEREKRWEKLLKEVDQLLTEDRDRSGLSLDVPSERFRSLSRVDKDHHDLEGRGGAQTERHLTRRGREDPSLRRHGGSLTSREGSHGSAELQRSRGSSAQASAVSLVPLSETAELSEKLSRIAIKGSGSEMDEQISEIKKLVDQSRSKRQREIRYEPNHPSSSSPLVSQAARSSHSSHSGTLPVPGLPLMDTGLVDEAQVLNPRSHTVLQTSAPDIMDALVLRTQREHKEAEQKLKKITASPTRMPLIPELGASATDRTPSSQRSGKVSERKPRLPPLSTPRTLPPLDLSGIPASPEPTDSSSSYARRLQAQQSSRSPNSPSDDYSGTFLTFVQSSSRSHSSAAALGSSTRRQPSAQSPSPISPKLLTSSPRTQRTSPSPRHSPQANALLSPQPLPRLSLAQSPATSSSSSSFADTLPSLSSPPAVKRPTSLLALPTSLPSLAVLLSIHSSPRTASLERTTPLRLTALASSRSDSEKVRTKHAKVLKDRQEEEAKRQQIALSLYEQRSREREELIRRKEREEDVIRSVRGAYLKTHEMKLTEKRWMILLLSCSRLAILEDQLGEDKARRLLRAEVARLRRKRIVERIEKENRERTHRLLKAFAVIARALGRFTLAYRCRNHAQHLELMRTFLLNVRVQMLFTIRVRAFRGFIVQSQRMTRSWCQCRRAREEAVELMWRYEEYVLIHKKQPHLPDVTKYPKGSGGEAVVEAMLKKARERERASALAGAGIPTISETDSDAGGDQVPLTILKDSDITALGGNSNARMFLSLFGKLIVPRPTTEIPSTIKAFLKAVNYQGPSRNPSSSSLPPVAAPSPTGRPALLQKQPSRVGLTRQPSSSLLKRSRSTVAAEHKQATPPQTPPRIHIDLSFSATNDASKRKVTNSFLYDAPVLVPPRIRQALMAKTMKDLQRFFSSIVYPPKRLIQAEILDQRASFNTSQSSSSSSSSFSTTAQNRRPKVKEMIVFPLYSLLRYLIRNLVIAGMERFIEEEATETSPPEHL